MILAVLSLLIFVHEFGHFIAAKKAGIKVLEFGFGLPPRIIGKKVGETIYSLNLLPIGGFVRLFGEEVAEMEEFKDEGLSEKEKIKRAFFAQSKKVRVVVLLAGVAMNLFLGIFLFSSLYTAIGIPTFTDGVQISGIFKDTPGESAFEFNDEIISVNSQKINKIESFKAIVDTSLGEEVEFEILRAGALMSVSAIPRVDPPVEEIPAKLKVNKGRISCVGDTFQQGALGVVISPKLEMVKFPFWQMPFRGAYLGLKEALAWGESIIKTLGGILSQLVCGTAPKGIGGPIEIGYQIAQASKEGIAPLLNLVAILSINLAVLNILPIPALDGGRLVFVVIEAITRKRSNQRLERIANSIGFAVLLTLLALISIQDLLRHFSLNSIKDLIEKVVPL